MTGRVPTLLGHELGVQAADELFDQALAGKSALLGLLLGSW
jgi:hypothetical protein